VAVAAEKAMAVVAKVAVAAKVAGEEKAEVVGHGLYEQLLHESSQTIGY
jgi:hypothetical protein